MSSVLSVVAKPTSGSRESREIINDLASKELIFAVVGPVGSGTTFVAKALEQLVKSALQTEKVTLIKASTLIAEKSTSPKDEKPLERAKGLQDKGDSLRQEDPSAIGNLLIAQVKATREIQDAEPDAGTGAIALRPVEAANTSPRVFILDSLKNPAEVNLLRSVYREAFCLIGVVCETDVRQQRLAKGKLKDSSTTDIESFMKRDEDAQDSWGQKVADTFHLADFFVDNTPDRFTQDKSENKDWVVNDKLGRLLDILTGTKVVRPFPSETGMFHAAGAQMRSACLSRQVGAALTDGIGNLIATGTNEVPRSGGGVYGDGFEVEHKPEDYADHRCVVTNRYCSNTKAQNEIMDEVIDAIPELSKSNDREKLKRALKETALGRLLEFSRAVHAEMDALLTAARLGTPTIGCKLFVTTFPCHYCARHIVSAGVDEVQYIEPYPKSRALTLHSDAIEQVFTKWITTPPKKPTKVLFRPFTGVAPRLYRRAFMKDRKLKNDAGNFEIGKPKWTTGLLVESYLQIETTLQSKGKNEST